MTQLLSLIAVVGLIALLIFGSIAERKEWNEFSRAHDCKVVEQIASKTVYSNGSNGKSYTEPARTVYLCNDGVRYTR